MQSNDLWFFILPGYFKHHPPPRGFSNVHAFFNWSSSTYRNIADYAWCVYMNVGIAYYDIKGITYVYIWPVRGGQ
jgi:hypothetical protein